MAHIEKHFYEQQYQGSQYATGLESGEEAARLRRFVESYDLQDRLVLEIGCGRGAFQHISRKWMGVDLAFSARCNIVKPFVIASADALPFRDESVHGVWSITVLEHVPGVEAALSEISRVLKQRGVAYLAPAWHCRTWAAEGYQVRPWSDFDWRGKLVKISIPLRNALWVRALCALPLRVWRESLFFLKGKSPMQFRYGCLQANYEIFWGPDSDACNSMDPHEMLLWFRSRGWCTPSHRTWAQRFMVRNGPIIVQKPCALEKN